MLVTGTLALLGIAAFLILSLTAGSVAYTILSAFGFLYAVWSTYDTFVLHQCWTLYLKVVE